VADVHRSLWLASRVEAFDYSDLGGVLQYCNWEYLRRADGLIAYTRRANPVPRDEVKKVPHGYPISSAIVGATTLLGGFEYAVEGQK
jgi:hypothetical protein